MQSAVEDIPVASLADQVPVHVGQFNRSDGPGLLKQTESETGNVIIDFAPGPPFQKVNSIKAVRPNMGRRGVGVGNDGHKSPNNAQELTVSAVWMSGEGDTGRGVPGR